ncbi:hypothetical protein [Nonomuraea sp. NPDC050783]|uniref:hypothetical protein n=1 Tax=Nonomuraea sp. NPDC050783 TaxID=3154634 RepID=UPI0034660B8E
MSSRLPLHRHLLATVTVQISATGTRTITEVLHDHTVKSGTKSRTLTVSGASQAEATGTFQQSWTDAVPQTPRLTPVTDHAGRCGSDVTYMLSARIDSEAAQTVRYRWVDA